MFFAAETSVELEASLNSDMNCISSWMQDNLFLNLSKTEYVIYGSYQRIKRKDSISLSGNGSPLAKSQSCKYLDVAIDQHFSFNNHIEHIVNVFRRLRISPTMAAAERIYNTTIVPVFGYCDVAWHGCGKVNWTLIPLRVCSIELWSSIFSNSGLHTKELIAALGLAPLTNRSKLHIVSLTRKCLDSLVPPYLNNYFNLNTSLHN